MKHSLPWREGCSLKDPNLPEHSLMTREDGGSWGEGILGRAQEQGKAPGQRNCMILGPFMNQAWSGLKQRVIE